MLKVGVAAVAKLADAEGPAPAPTTTASAPATASVPATRGGPDADEDLRDLADRADTDTRRHVRWLRGRISQAAAQALVLG